jgi:hypothetical protein
MPYYKTKQLEATVTKAETRGERIVQVVTLDDGSFAVITETRVNDTGRPWSPSGMEQRA